MVKEHSFKITTGEKNDWPLTDPLEINNDFVSNLFISQQNIYVSALIWPNQRNQMKPTHPLISHPLKMKKKNFVLFKQKSSVQVLKI